MQPRRSRLRRPTRPVDATGIAHGLPETHEVRSESGVHDNAVRYTERISVEDPVTKLASAPMSEPFRHRRQAPRDTTRAHYNNEDAEWGVCITFLFSLPAAT
jgi:hypothetical protein